MDLLNSLDLDVLPEQQTRINKDISRALELNPDIRLGFDACAYCGTTLKENKEDVPCRACKRVWYCSKECRLKDAECNNSGGDDQEDGKGHSAIICSLLKLCNTDEDVQDEMKGNQSLKKVSKRLASVSEDERKTAHERISTEYESYPATLANTLMDAPCFEPILERFVVKRRSKKTRQSDLEERDDHGKNHTLTIHVIGASQESELWGDFKLDQTDAKSAYIEALSELFANYKGLHKIRLAFIGPNCPTEDLHIVKTMGEGIINPGDEDSASASKQHPSGKKRMRDEVNNNHHHRKNQVIIETHRHNYELKYFQKNGNDTSKKGKHTHHRHLSKPDVVVFFNPGFTCPDYDWIEALKVCQSHSSSQETPFLVATNTEYEAIADLQYLHMHGYIHSLPPMVADIVNEGRIDHDNDTFDESNAGAIFFGENNNAGSRVRQSGNMANDLYCKNKYIFGGHLNSSQSQTKKKSNKQKDSTLKEAGKSSIISKEQKNISPSKKKKSNAALM